MASTDFYRQDTYRGDIYTEREGITAPLGLSVALHGMLFASVLIYGAVIGRSGANWGGGIGGGDAMSVNVVNNIPIPRPQQPTENIVANDSKGLTQSVPKAVETPKPDAIPIPDKVKNPPKPITSRIKPPEHPPEPPPNQVPFGQGGPVSGPYGSFTTSNAKGGLGVTGQGGDFGTLYAWYVRQINQKISDNWNKYEIDPSVSHTNRVYISFEVDRGGRPTKVQVEQSSGVPSLDISAVRALQRIDTFGPLPQDYRGGYINVEFWFDASR
jgi:protein TonB